MTRTLEAQQLVALPVLSAAETLTLATMLETHAAAATLTPSLEDARATLAEAREALGAELAKQRKEQVRRTDAVAADVRLDRVWSGLADVLLGWSKVELTPESDLAEALRGRLFPDGLAFLNATYPVEWAESESKLRIIEQEQLGASLTTLGAQRLLEQLRAAHAAYGEALGVTQAAAVTETADVRTAMVEAQGALREYVAAVVGSVRRKAPASAELAAELLRPLSAWTSKKGATAGEDAEDATDSDADGGVTATKPA